MVDGDLTGVAYSEPSIVRDTEHNSNNNNNSSNTSMSRMREGLVGRCTLHPHDVLDMFCVECRGVVCSHCLLVGLHKGHSHRPAVEAVAEVKARLAALAGDLEDRQRGVIRLRASLQQGKGEIADTCHRMREGFHNEMRAGLDALARFEDATVDELGAGEDAVAAAVEAQVPVVAAQIERMDKMLRLAQKLYQERDPERWMAETLLAEQAIDALNSERNVDRVLAAALETAKQRSMDELGRWSQSVEEKMLIMESVVAIICNPEEARDIIAKGRVTARQAPAAVLPPGTPSSQAAAISSSVLSSRRVPAPAQAGPSALQGLATATSPTKRTPARKVSSTPAQPLSAPRSARPASSASKSRFLSPALSRAEEAKAAQLAAKGNLDSLVQRVLMKTTVVEDGNQERGVLPPSAYAGTPLKERGQPSSSILSTPTHKTPKASHPKTPK
jgi:hypothetical protein